jgi:hypothetical protein
MACYSVFLVVVAVCSFLVCLATDCSMQQIFHGLGCSLWALTHIAEYGYKYLRHTKWNMECGMCMWENVGTGDFCFT